MPNFVRDDLDYLKKMEATLRTLPRKQINGGVLVVELTDDGLTPFCEFLRKLIAETERQIEADNIWARRVGWLGNVSGVGADPDTV